MANTPEVPISEQLVILQEAQKTLAEATQNIGEHNQAEDAHPIILRMIRDLQENESIYTRSEIIQIISDMLLRHTTVDFKEAHPGWEAFYKKHEDAIAKIDADLRALINRIDVEKQAEQSQRTSLDKALQDVENRYAPLLANLASAYQEAERTKNDILAESYRKSISDTLEEKRKELLKTMEDWSAQYKGK